MRTIKIVSLIAFAFAFLGFSSAPSVTAAAQVSVGVNLGAAPDCPYGYFDYAPYSCAPYGYYGPEWFNGGVFLGAGPWFHGPSGFHGSVNNHFSPQHGYHGAMPKAHSKPAAGHAMAPSNFHGNETRDGQGHTVGGGGGGRH